MRLCRDRTAENMASVKKKKRYSYIRYPHAKNGVLCAILGGAALLVTLAVCAVAIVKNGNTTEPVAAWGVLAMVLGAAGIWFSLLALFEEDKNYLLAGIGGGISLITVIGWILILAKG